MTTRGLEPAGVDLQAKGFKQYIANLDQIEKKQREVFDREFKGTQKSFAQVQSAARSYERQLKSLESQYNRAVAQEQKLRQAQERTRAGTTALGSAFNQLAAIALSRQTAQFVIDSAQMASNFEAARIGLDNLAASFGVAGNEIRNAIRQAARGTLSETQIILAANKSLQLEVAKTPEEFARVTKNALILGKTLGLDASESIDQFTTALGRKTILILDNFGIKMEQVNEQIAILGQERFGLAFKDLSTAQTDLLFIEAALRVADERVQAIGEHAIEAGGSFDRLAAQSENLKLVFGTAILPATSEFADLLADALVSAQQALAFIAAGAAGIGSIFKDITPAANVGDLFEQFRAGQITFAEFLFGTDEPQEDKTFEQILDDASQKAVEAFKDVARAQGIAFPEDIADEATKSIEENTEALEQNEELIKSLQNAIKQAEQLELSFARAAEDAARRLSRQQAKLARDQFKDRVDLLNDQAKEFDQFQQDELESVQEAEQELAEAREKAGKERLREQDKLHRELKQARDRFNLDAIQSQRRFDLQDRRLRAAGDILALQELREDFKLQELEAKENFDLQNRQRKEDAKDQTDVADERRQEQISELEQELKDLQDGLDQRRTEFLQSQEEEFNNLLAAQAEQQLALRESYLEQQEDARINQQRQLEDLGRSLADQQDLTAEGAMRIAEELEAVFGVEGVADTIFAGWTARTESEFTELFNNVESIIGETAQAIEELSTGGGGAPLEFGAGGANPATFGIPSFHQGGVVPGPRGSEQVIRALGGETVLPTHQMNAPIVPSQNLNVNMSGGFNISGGEGAGQAATQAAIVEMTEAFEIAVKRLGRRI